MGLVCLMQHPWGPMRAAMLRRAAMGIAAPWMNPPLAIHGERPQTSAPGHAPIRTCQAAGAGSLSLTAATVSATGQLQKSPFMTRVLVGAGEEGPMGPLQSPCQSGATVVLHQTQPLVVEVRVLVPGQPQQLQLGRRMSHAGWKLLACKAGRLSGHGQLLAAIGVETSLIQRNQQASI